MEPLVLNAPDIDADITSASEKIVEHLRASGRYFYDPISNSFIVAVGQGGAVRIVPEKIGENLTLTGQVRIFTGGVGRLPPAPMSAGAISPYERRLSTAVAYHADRLPHAYGTVWLPQATVGTEGNYVQLGPAYSAERHLVYFGSGLDPHAVEAVDRDYPHLTSWLSALEFTSPCFRANLYGFVVACFARTECPTFPFLLVDATSKKQGKTTLVEALAYLITGRTVTPITYTGDESEVEKRLAGSCGKPGPNVIFIDNVRAKRGQTSAIRSQFLAVASTSPYPAIRPVYGKQNVPIDWPIIMMTMNEGSVESDLHDRSVRLVLTGKEGRYFDPHPLEYVKAHRMELLAEIFAILRDTQADPEGFCPATRFGEFEAIAQQAAEKLNMAVRFDPDAIDTPDNEVRELVAFVESACEEKGGPVSVDDLGVAARFAQNTHPELCQAIRNAHAATDRTRGRVIMRLVEKLQRRSIHLNGRKVHFTLTEEHGSRRVAVVRS